MTTPQDPNQPAGGTPPPAPNIPGWGAPPPQQPGWGQPQPGWGQPQPGWGQSGWGAAPPPKRSNRRGCLIAILVVFILLVIGVGGCTYLVWPYVQMDLKLMQDVGTDRVSSVSFNVTNGHQTWVIHLQPGHESEAASIACGVVGPDLRDSQFRNDDFQIVDSNGNVLATNATPCQ
jgi:hypothetical protein